MRTRLFSLGALLLLVRCNGYLTGADEFVSEELPSESLGGTPPILPGEPLGGAGGAGGAGQEPVFAFLPCEVAEIIRTKCVRCHGAALENEPLLLTFDSVSRNLDLIIESVEDDYMPMRQTPLTDVQKAVLRDWSSAGAEPFIGATAPICE